MRVTLTGTAEFRVAKLLQKRIFFDAPMLAPDADSHLKKRVSTPVG
jgi:hypothetical protein